MPLFSTAGMTLVATTGITGYTLVNGTGSIPGTSWTPANDGQMHRFMIMGNLIVGSDLTGGQISVSFKDPAGNARVPTVLASGQTAGYHALVSQPLITCAGGTAVVLTQSVAASVGAGVLYAEIWGS